jgi:uncharacterized protein
MAATSFADNGGLTAGAPRRMPWVLACAYLVVFAGLIATLGGVAYFGRPSDGDPVARIDLSARTHAQNAGASRLVAATRASPAATGSQSALQLQPALPSIPSSGAPVEKPVLAGKNLVADPALIEQTPQGPLPRIGADGRTPMDAYAPPVAPSSGPRIAMVVSGLGISAKATEAAIKGLPPGVTLAFAPYESDVQRWVGEARSLGHEVLLEVPMEPYDFPDSDPGPHTLRAAVGEGTNTERLVWSLTRFTGYSGITNLLGGRLLGDTDSLEPIMTYVARRGLLFFDSGPQTHSVAPDIARNINAPYVQSSMTVDTIQTGMEIDARLSELEKLARTNGSAAGTGFLYPVTVDRIANWAKGLEGRGFVLVPASAIVAPSK